MTSRYNPNNSAIAGDEWYGALTVQKHPGSSFQVGTIIVSTATESIDEIIPWVTPPSTLRGLAQLRCDIYDEATLPAGWPGTDLPETRRWIKPVSNSGATISGAWQKNTSGVLTASDANDWQQVDDDISDQSGLGAGSSDAMRWTSIHTNGDNISFKGGSSFFDGVTGTSTSDLTGLRISGIEVVVTYQPGLTQAASLTPFLNIGGVDCYGAATSINGIGNKFRARYTFTTDPTTGLPWTNAAAQTFVATASSYFGVALKAPVGAGAVDVTSIGLMFHTVPERRVAIATASLATSEGWLPLTCQAVADATTSAWSKVSGHTYRLVFFPSTGLGDQVKVNGITTSSVSGHELDPALFAGQDFSTAPGAVPFSARDADLVNLAVLLGSTPSADSQPYVTARVDSVGGPTNNILKQQISDVGTATYGLATMVLRTTSAASNGVADQNAPLNVTLKRTADDAILAGPDTIAPTDVPPDGKWHVVTLRWTSPAVLTATEPVYLQLDSGSTVAWEAVALLTRTDTTPNTDPISVAAAGVGIGSTTDSANPGSGLDQTIDYPWNIGTVPDAPTGTAAVVATVANQPALTGTAAIPTIPYVALTWNPTSLGANFGYYELLRAEPDGTFYTIAKITNETSAYFNDFETRRNDPAGVAYVVRVIRADGQPSPFVLFGLMDVPADECSLILASNADPAKAMAVQDASPYEWTRAASSSVVVQKVYGRKYPVQFQPNGDGGGDIITRTILVATNDPSISGPFSAGRAVFDPLVAICEAPLPYIAVCDGLGRRWLSGLTIGRMTRTEPGGDYVAAVTCNEVADTPTAVITDLPWSP